MKKWLTLINFRGWLGAGGGLLVALLLAVALFIHEDNQHSYSLTHKEQQMVSDIMQKPMTRYFGHYAVDLPDEFLPTADMFMAVQGSDMTKIEVKQQYYPPFEQFLRRYKDKLEKTQPVDAIDAPYLKQVYLLPSGMKGQIFERMEEQGYSDAARVLDAYKWEDGVTFFVIMKAKDGRAKRYDKNRETFKYSYIYNVPEKKSQLLTLLTGLHPRKDNQRPQGRNLAIKYAEIDESLLGEYETSVNYADGRGININLNTDNSSYRGTPLLERDHRVVEGEFGKTLYKGNRKVNGLEASEWLVKEYQISEGVPLTTYTFTLRMHEGRQKGASPLELNMTYISHEIAPDKLLSEAELVTIWQHITETINYYPSW